MTLLPQKMKLAGYRTAMTGKWHCGARSVKNLPISDRLKNRIFSTHANGALTRLKSYGLDKIPNKAKNRLTGRQHFY